MATEQPVSPLSFSPLSQPPSPLFSGDEHDRSGVTGSHSSATSISSFADVEDKKTTRGNDTDFSRLPFETIIFDLGDVLFQWSDRTSTAVAPETLRKILRSMAWLEYEKGNLEEEECYTRVGTEFGHTAAEVSAAFAAARASLTTNARMVALVRALRQARPALRVFAMTNTSAPDFRAVRTKIAEENWTLFDRVFTSAEAGERKPHLGFYRLVLRETGATPGSTLFVDDKPENVLSARSLGLSGILFDGADGLERQLKELCVDSAGPGERWLHAHAKTMDTITETGVTLRENFSQMLMLEVTGDASLVDYVEFPRHFNFFKDLRPPDFPYDLDSTSIGLTVTSHVDAAMKQSVMDEMLTYRSNDGIMQSYFDASRPRLDPIVCTNILTFFYSNGRGHELRPTLDWVHAVLLHRAYLVDTTYYTAPDPFLWFLTRLLRVAPDLRTRLEPLVRARLIEHFGAEGDALALGMRVDAAAQFGIRATVDCQRLKAMQLEDGAWPAGWIYRYPGSGKRIGNQGLTTAIAVRAIRAFERLQAEGSDVHDDTSPLNVPRSQLGVRSLYACAVALPCLAVYYYLRVRL